MSISTQVHITTPTNIRLAIMPEPTCILQRGNQAQLASTALGTTWDLELQRRTLNLLAGPGHRPRPLPLGLRRHFISADDQHVFVY